MKFVENIDQDQKAIYLDYIFQTFLKQILEYWTFVQGLLLKNQ